MTTSDTQTPDAKADSWVARMPRAVRPYLRLMRLDRPIGAWLLLWPCWWSIALAGEAGAWPDLGLLALFAVGSLVMRGAGCVFNDIVDREYDAKVARTADRPIPSGQVSVLGATAFMSTLAFFGLLVLLQLNAFTILMGMASLVLVAVYPFMKRVTYWPQIWLGLTFNWGALLGWAAVRGELSLTPILLYAGCIFWTLGYDTIYAHQDKEDDILAGVKSTALLLGENSKVWIAGFFAAAMALFTAAGLDAGLGALYVILLALPAAHLAWQVRVLDIDNAAICLRLFRSNTVMGWLMFGAIVAARYLEN